MTGIATMTTVSRTVEARAFRPRPRRPARRRSLAPLARYRIQQARASASSAAHLSRLVLAPSAAWRLPQARSSAPDAASRRPESHREKPAHCPALCTDHRSARADTVSVRQPGLALKEFRGDTALCGGSVVRRSSRQRRRLQRPGAHPAGQKAGHAGLEHRQRGHTRLQSNRPEFQRRAPARFGQSIRANEFQRRLCGCRGLSSQHGVPGPAILYQLAINALDDELKEFKLASSDPRR